MKFLKKLLIAAVILLTFGFAQASTIDNLRGQRYCEILLAEQQDRMPQIKVFNTIGLNQCPAVLWDKLNAKEIKKQTHAFSVRFNGPRFWTIDGVKDSNFINPTVVTFGGIAMREAGILKMRWLDFLQTLQPYIARQVQRQTTWVYQAGKPVYELIDPRGNVYIMQSYSVEKISQTEASLSGLGSKLKLPTGWSFRTRVLKKTAYLTPVNQLAVVVQDDFLNTYQQVIGGQV